MTTQNNKLRWFSSTNKNAPQLNNTWGAVVNLFNKCLVEGFGLLTTTSNTFNGEYLTLAFSEAHGLQQYQTVKITGSSIEALDRLHTIYSLKSSTEIVIKILNNTLTSVPTLLSVSLPSLGWESLYNENNKAVFKTTADEGPNHCMFVKNDLPDGYNTTWWKFANIGMAEGYDSNFTPLGFTQPVSWSSFAPSGSGDAMSLGVGALFYNCTDGYDINSGPAPYYGSSNGNCDWLLIGNNSYFYLLHAPFINRVTPVLTAFGQYDSLHNGFQYNTILGCNAVDQTRANQGYPLGQYNWAGGTTTQSLRTLSGYNNTSIKSLNVNSYNEINVSGYANWLNPSGPINLFKPYVRDSNNILMGTLRNLYWIGVTTPYKHKQVFKQGPDIYIAITSYIYYYTGQVIFKIGEEF